MSKARKVVSRIEFGSMEISVNGRSLRREAYSRTEYTDGTVEESSEPQSDIKSIFDAIAGAPKKQAKKVQK